MRAFGAMRRPDPSLRPSHWPRSACFALGTWHFRWSFGTRLADRRLFRAEHDDDDRVRRHHANRGDRQRHCERDGADAARHALTGFYRFRRIAADPRAMGRMQGLRPIQRRGHIVVCGAAASAPASSTCCFASTSRWSSSNGRLDASLVERARDRGFDLLTGDASRDDALDLCNLAAAHSLSR